MRRPIDGRYEAVGVSDPDRVSGDVSSVCVDSFMTTLWLPLPPHRGQFTLNEIIRLLHVQGEMHQDVLMLALGLSDRKQLQSRHLQPSMDLRLIKMTLPDKSKSTRQCYRLTPAGDQAKQALKREADDE